MKLRSLLLGLLAGCGFYLVLNTPCLLAVQEEAEPYGLPAEAFNTAEESPFDNPSFSKPKEEKTDVPYQDPKTILNNEATSTFGNPPPARSDLRARSYQSHRAEAKRRLAAFKKSKSA
jgi:hypothetical protein